MRERGVLTCAGTLLGTVALVALFASTEHGRIVFTLGGSARLPQRAKPSSVVAKEFDMGCRLSNWVGLGKCKKGMAEPGCAEAYNSWFASGCLCDYSAYPWGFLPKDITPVGFMWYAQHCCPRLCCRSVPRAHRSTATCRQRRV